MNFTFNEWKTIDHALDVAYYQYDKQMRDSTPSDEETSIFQIFKRQCEEVKIIRNKIKIMKFDE
jgi:hypothetical protein